VEVVGEELLRSVEVERVRGFVQGFDACESDGPFEDDGGVGGVEAVRPTGGAARAAWRVEAERGGDVGDRGGFLAVREHTEKGLPLLTTQGVTDERQHLVSESEKPNPNSSD